MTHTAIPEEEIESFKALGPMTVIFDVGAREDLDYVAIHPKAEFHLFEPNPEFFAGLKKKAETEYPDKNITLNEFGLGERAGTYQYSDAVQGFIGGDASVHQDFTQKQLPIATLDDYVAQKGITHIDFLKIDTEGYDFNVLLGGLDTLAKCRYIQYEHWDRLKKFHRLLGSQFKMTYIGYRNVLCERL